VGFPRNRGGTEAHQRGWTGEIEGLQISLAGATQKLEQIGDAIAVTHLPRSLLRRPPLESSPTSID
jgi:hypothetical protein